MFQALLALLLEKVVSLNTSFPSRRCVKACRVTRVVLAVLLLFLKTGWQWNVMSEGGGAAVAAPIDVRYTVERINSVDYVTADQFQAGMRQAASQGAKQGEQQTLKRLQMSSSTRKRVGM